MDAGRTQKLADVEEIKLKIYQELQAAGFNPKI
jgi:hypothetical protein